MRQIGVQRNWKKGTRARVQTKQIKRNPATGSGCGLSCSSQYQYSSITQDNVFPLSLALSLSLSRSLALFFWFASPFPEASGTGKSVKLSCFIACSKCPYEAQYKVGKTLKLRRRRGISLPRGMPAPKRVKSTG